MLDAGGGWEGWGLLEAALCGGQGRERERILLSFPFFSRFFIRFSARFEPIEKVRRHCLVMFTSFLDLQWPANQSAQTETAAEQRNFTPLLVDRALCRKRLVQGFGKGEGVRLEVELVKLKIVRRLKRRTVVDGLHLEQRCWHLKKH